MVILGSSCIRYYLALARNNFAYHSLLLGRLVEASQSVAQGIKIAEAYNLLAALLLPYWEYSHLPGP